MLEITLNLCQNQTLDLGWNHPMVAKTPL
jgi:hypothetical protein